MSHNYVSAFARVSDGDGNRTTTQSGTIPQTYQQLAAFSMPPPNPSMFPSATVAANSTPAHSHHQSSGQQPTTMLPASPSQPWTQMPRPMIPTSNMPVGTPLLEWNGTEWIPPQQSSLAAVAAGQQVTLPNASVQSLQSTYTLSQLTAWTPQHIDNQQSANHNQPAHSQPPQSVSASNSFTASDNSQHCAQPAKPPRKRPAKAKQKQPTGGHETAQHGQQMSVMHGINRTNSTEDLLSAEQIARVSGGVPSKEDAAARDSLLALASQTAMIPTPQQMQQQAAEGPVLTELTPVIRAARPASPPKPQAPPPPPSRPVVPFDGSFAVCPNCGTMSKDYINCDSCTKELPEDCKRYDPVKRKEEELRRKKEKQKKMENERLLLAKLKQEQLKKQQEEVISSPDGTNLRSRAIRGGRAGASNLPTTKSFYGRKIAVKDYSDDDPQWTPGTETASRAKSRGGGKMATGAKRGRKPKEAEVYVISDSEESEDEYVLSTPRARKAPITSPPTTPGVRGRPRNNIKTQKPDLTHVPELLMKCTKITMGSVQGSPKKPLHISISGVDISLETEKEVVSIMLDNRDVRECLCCTHYKLPVLIFRANTTFGSKVRDALKMVDPEDDPYYDPDSNDARHKYIVGFLDDKAQISNLGWRLQDVFRAISLQYQTGGVLLRFIELPKAESLLAKIAGKEGQSTTISALDELALSYDDEDIQEQRSPKVFMGPVARMFMYPFAPSLGSISVTNEDYFCLYDGEFLNDVVITFYLKYLTEQVLSEADRDRTYIFNTFFYTKLNQPFSATAAKDAKKSAAEKRHNRVKTWTKNVDLFSKDFIIVPINEHSHWYLAIICYPYLTEPVYEGSPSTHSSGEDNVVSSTTSEDAAGSAQAANAQPPGGSTSAGSSSQPSESAMPSLQSVHESASQSNTSTTASSGSIEEVAPPDNGSTSRQQDQESTTSSLAKSEIDELFGFEDSDDDDILTDGATPNFSKINKRPCILIFDSLAGPGHAAVFRTLRDYLAMEWKVRKGTERSFSKDVFKGSNVKCPQQNNYSDCGIYLLQYVESFFQKPITNWSLPMKCTLNMFEYSDIKHKRQNIQALMDKLEEEFINRPKPASNRGRPRNTRHSVAAAQASAEAKRAKMATTHSTTVPEALGLALTPRKEGEVKETPIHVAHSGCSIPEKVQQKKLPATQSARTEYKDGGKPSTHNEPANGQGSRGERQKDKEVPAFSVQTDNAEEAVDAAVLADRPVSESAEVGGVRHSVEQMEVKDDVVHTEEMDHTPNPKEDEYMQTDSPSRPNAGRADDAAMLTDSV